MKFQVFYDRSHRIRRFVAHLAFILFFIMGMFSARNGIAQDYQTQGQLIGENVQVTDNAGNTPVEEGADKAQLQQAGIPIGNVYPSADIPDADWIIEVPIDIQGISEEVKAVNIECEVYQKEPSVGYGGWNSKIVPLENGAYQGRVLVGVLKLDDVSYEDASNANHYACNLYFCTNPNNCGSLLRPGPDQQRVPAFLRMNPNRPFRASVSGPLN